jgi:hypothetical protein
LLPPLAWGSKAEALGSLATGLRGGRLLQLSTIIETVFRARVDETPVLRIFVGRLKRNLELHTWTAPAAMAN